MTDKPEALRLADALQQQAVWEGHYGPSYLRDMLSAAAAELRRLHSENIAAVSSFLSADDERIKLRAQRDELLHALKLAWPIIENEKFRQECSYASNFRQHRADHARVAYERAKSVFAKIGENK